MRQASTEEEAKEAAAPFIDKHVSLKNIETGFEASVSKRAFWKMLNHSAHRYSVDKEAHYLAMANIDKLFRLATREMPPGKD